MNNKKLNKFRAEKLVAMLTHGDDTAHHLSVCCADLVGVKPVHGKNYDARSIANISKYLECDATNIYNAVSPLAALKQLLNA